MLFRTRTCCGIRLRLNGEVMQDSSTAQLIFGVDQLIAFLCETVTLEPGDVIATGTPLWRRLRADSRRCS